MTGARTSLDALLPAEMAVKDEEIGVEKAGMNAVSVLALAVLAGAFIALGAVFATTVASGASGVLPGGVTRLLVRLPAGEAVVRRGYERGSPKTSVGVYHASAQAFADRQRRSAIVDCIADRDFTFAARARTTPERSGLIGRNDS